MNTGFPNTLLQMEPISQAEREDDFDRRRRFAGVDFGNAALALDSARSTSS